MAVCRGRRLTPAGRDHGDLSEQASDVSSGAGAANPCRRRAHGGQGRRIVPQACDLRGKLAWPGRITARTCSDHELDVAFLLAG